MANIAHLFKKADAVYQDANKPGGAIIYDGDSILRDYGLDVDPYTYPQISRVYAESKHKRSIAEMFEVLTGHTLEEYLTTCIYETYRRE